VALLCRVYRAIWLSSDVAWIAHALTYAGASAYWRCRAALLFGFTVPAARQHCSAAAAARGGAWRWRGGGWADGRDDGATATLQSGRDLLWACAGVGGRGDGWHVARASRAVRRFACLLTAIAALPPRISLLRAFSSFSLHFSWCTCIYHMRSLASSMNTCKTVVYAHGGCVCGTRYGRGFGMLLSSPRWRGRLTWPPFTACPRVRALRRRLGRRRAVAV